MIKEWEIYRYWNIDNELLYIGISYDAYVRHKQHMIKENNVWKNLYVRHEREKFTGTRKELEVREKFLIKTEKPIYNVTHNTKKEPILNIKKEPISNTKKKNSYDNNVEILSEELMPYYEKFMSLLEYDKDYVEIEMPKHLSDELWDKLRGFSSIGTKGCSYIAITTSRSGKCNIDDLFGKYKFSTYGITKHWCISARDNNDILFNYTKCYEDEHEYVPIWKFPTPKTDIDKTKEILFLKSDKIHRENIKGNISNTITTPSFLCNNNISEFIEYAVKNSTQKNKTNIANLRAALII